MKVAIFDDHVIMTGANLSELYFLHRTDRYFLFKHTPDLANFADDLVNNLIDVSMQMNDGGELMVQTRQIPKGYPNTSRLMRGRAVPMHRQMTEDRLKITKYLHRASLKIQRTE